MANLSFFVKVDAVSNEILELSGFLLFAGDEKNDKFKIVQVEVDENSVFGKQLSFGVLPKGWFLNANHEIYQKSPVVNHFVFHCSTQPLTNEIKQVTATTTNNNLKFIWQTNFQHGTKLALTDFNQIWLILETVTVDENRQFSSKYNQFQAFFVYKNDEN